MLSKISSGKWMTALALITACGNSPIFNHVSAEQVQASTPNGPAACQISFSKLGLCADAKWTVFPRTREKVGEAAITFFNQANATETVALGAKDGKPLTLEGNLLMPAHGHDDDDDTLPVIQPVLNPEKVVVRGLYLLQGAAPTMRGAWDVELFVKDADGKLVDQAKFGVQIK